MPRNCLEEKSLDTLVVFTPLSFGMKILQKAGAERNQWAHPARVQMMRTTLGGGRDTTARPSRSGT